jgi:hypothetical protein
MVRLLCRPARAAEPGRDDHTMFLSESAVVSPLRSTSGVPRLTGDRIADDRAVNPEVRASLDYPIRPTVTQ